MEPAASGPIGLDQLERFLRHPVRAFLRERLDIWLGDRTQDFEDAIPIDLNGLERWQIADRVLKEQLGGADLTDCLDAERARGGLPPGQLADAVLNRIAAPLAGLVAVGQHAMPPLSLDVHVDLTGGRSVVGTVAGVRGDMVHTVTYSKLNPAHRLMAWVRLLVLSATWPERPFSARTVGPLPDARVPPSPLLTSRRSGPTRPAAGRRRSRTSERWWRCSSGECVSRSRSTPTRPPRWAGAVAEGGIPTGRAAAEWVSGSDYSKEDKEPEHLLVLGGALSFGDVLQACRRAPGRRGRVGSDGIDAFRRAARAPHLG